MQNTRPTFVKLEKIHFRPICPQNHRTRFFFENRSPSLFKLIDNLPSCNQSDHSCGRFQRNTSEKQINVRRVFHLTLTPLVQLVTGFNLKTGVKVNFVLKILHTVQEVLESVKTLILIRFSMFHTS